MVPWDRRTNTGRMRLAPRMKHYHAFAAVCDYHQECHNHEHVRYRAHTIPNDRTEASGDRSQAQSTSGGENNNPPTIEHKEDEENLADFFEDEQSPTIIMDEESDMLATTSPQAELLIWHYRLGHTSFAKLKLIAALGILPMRLAAVHPPKCAGRIFGAMTEKPWRTKSDPSKVKTVVVTGPGDRVSEEKLESRTPGFVAQLKDILTKRTYKCATVFVDHFSRLGHVHMQQQLTSDDTVDAKSAFEAFTRSQGVTIKHYHADNGRFYDYAFLKDVREARTIQSITFCGVYAHFQNGIAEKKNPRSPGAYQEAAPACQGQMASSCHHQFVAICLK
jgi:hypothetical protein